MTFRIPRSWMAASSSTAPGSGLIRSETGIDMARRMRRMVAASAGSPQRLRHPVMSISAGELIETLFSVEMARASSPGRLLSIRSSASASTVAASIPGIAARIRRRRPAASALRIGQEFGHRVPPTSMSATSRDFTSPPAGEVGPGRSRPRPGGDDRLGRHGGHSMIACMLRWLTSGESHGPQLTVVIEGLPSGLAISEEDLRKDLARRQGGHGRGGRQKIETDFARIVSGVRGGFTIGSPVTLVLENKDHVNWTGQMTASKEGVEPKVVTRIRPGHGDLAGALKYGHTDIRNVLERSSARETATRVAAGGVAKKLLGHFGIDVISFTQSVGPVDIGFAGCDPSTIDVDDVERSPVRCTDPAASARMVAAIDEAGARGDTLGGTFRVVARGVPPGLGSFVHWDRKLDGRLAHAILSINAVKGVEFGAGFEGVSKPGSQFHDEIDYREGRFHQLTNRAVGTPGGVRNGEPIDLRVAMKPISTMKNPMPSIDLKTH